VFSRSDLQRLISHLFECAQKTFEEDGYIKRYMDTWSLEELQQCRSLVYPDMLPESVDERYETWGGSQRYVLSKLDAVDQAGFEHAVTACSIEMVQRANGGVLAHADLDDRLFHLRVESDCISTHIAWASNQACDGVADNLDWPDQRALCEHIHAIALP
jgi:hypothetical protein